MKIRLVGGQAMLYWPVNVNGFVLEETTSLASGVWGQVPQPVVDTAAEHNVTIPASGMIKLYRLQSK